MSEARSLRDPTSSAAQRFCARPGEFDTGPFLVLYYMDNGAPHYTATYRSLMWQLEQSDVVYLEASARTITLGSVTLRILPPPAEGDHNNRSVGVVVEFGEFKAILTGDSEWQELQQFLTLFDPGAFFRYARAVIGCRTLTPVSLASSSASRCMLGVDARARRATPLG